MKNGRKGRKVGVCKKERKKEKKKKEEKREQAVLKGKRERRGE